MRRPIRIATLAVIVPLSVLALAACTPGTAIPVVPTASASPTASAAPGPTVADIATLARRDVGEGTVVSVADESAGTEWDVRVVLADGTVQELHLSTDGTVLAGPTANTTGPDVASANRAQVAATAVTLAAAHTKMLATVPGGRVTAIGLDTYQSRVVWRGDVLVAGLRHDVRIDAVNGSVLLDQPDAGPTPAPTGGS